MRTIVMSGLLLAVYSVNLMAEPTPADPKPKEPTDEQIAEATKAYAKFGATYFCQVDLQTHHRFFMPDKTTDADLKNLPDLTQGNQGIQEPHVA